APYSRQAVGQLRALGLRVVLLSTDSPAVTAAVAREVSFDEIVSDVTENQQEEIISSLKSRGSTVGIVGGRSIDNFSSAADVKILLGVLEEIGEASAGIVVPGDLRGVGRTILLSRAIMGAIRANLGFAVVYNALLIPLAAIGMLPGVLAAAASAAAGVTV